MFSKTILATLFALAAGASFAQGASFGISDTVVNSNGVIAVQPGESLNAAPQEINISVGVPVQKATIDYEGDIVYTPPAINVVRNDVIMIKNEPGISIKAVPNSISVLNSATATNNSSSNDNNSLKNIKTVSDNELYAAKTPPVFQKSDRKILKPEDALKASETAVKELDIARESIKVELKEKAQKHVYSVSGLKEAKLFFVLPVKMNVETEVNAETGEVVSINKPWWSFLAS